MAGLLVGLLTEYYTSHDFKPVREVAKSSETGAATNIIFGLALGYHSATGSILILAVSIFLPFTLAGMYGVAVAAIGMLSTLVVGLTIDAYGPVADNAGGIAEMTGMGEKIRDRTDVLDSAGNTTAAIGKGFAIGSAALTALALFAAFRTTVFNVRYKELIESGMESVAAKSQAVVSIDISNAWVMAGLFVGGMLPFLFSSMAMGAVGRAAMAMIEEVRRQFREIPELKKALELMQLKDEKDWDEDDRAAYEIALGKAEHGRCVEISTQSAIKEMVMPGLLAVSTPVIVGFIFGAETLGGLLAGVTVCGVLMAIFQSNSGGAWDNAKKMIEEGITVNGQELKKGSNAHKAAVVGDTVGDPFKDTSGPSLNILIKLMAVVSLVIAPLIK